MSFYCGITLNIAYKSFKNKNMEVEEMAITLYHFTNSKISKFIHHSRIQGYSRSSGYGIYFTPDYERGLMKYGAKAKYVYTVLYHGTSILNLGEYDSMYYNGNALHSSSLVTENFKRSISGLAEIPQPDVIIEHLSKQAFDWLKSQGIQAVYGMDYWGYACPEFCVIDESQIEIIGVNQLR